MTHEELVEKVARGICLEKCAFMGEPACWQVEGHEGQLAPSCDEPGCLAEATAAIAIAGEALAKAVQCDCCDVCGESPEFEHVCANEIASRIRALTGAKENDIR